MNIIIEMSGILLDISVTIALHLVNVARYLDRGPPETAPQL